MDSNVLLYGLDSVHAAKQRAAWLWIDSLWESGLGRLSWQVLNEFYVNATRKIGAPAVSVRESVERYLLWQPVEVHGELIRRAWHWTDSASMNYWDSLILAAAERAGCRWLLSEDFQEGRMFGAVRVVNPFHMQPGEIGFDQRS